MNHTVLQGARDTVAVVVAERMTAAMTLNGWIMDEDRMMTIEARQNMPVGHRVALKAMAPGDTLIMHGVDRGKVAAHA